LFAYLGPNQLATSTIELVADKSASTSFQYKTPNIADAKLGAVALAKQGKGAAAAFRSGLEPSASGVDLVVHEAPIPTLPVDGATQVDLSTAFLFTPLEKGIHIVHIWAGPPYDVYFFVVTTGGQTHIPDLTKFGLAIPKNADMQWNIYSWGPFATMDEAAGPNGFTSQVTAPHPPRLQGYSGYTETRGFTTAP
jgi:hypothetical protein